MHIEVEEFFVNLLQANVKYYQLLKFSFSEKDCIPYRVEEEISTIATHFQYIKRFRGKKISYICVKSKKQGKCLV